MPALAGAVAAAADDGDALGRGHAIPLPFYSEPAPGSHAVTRAPTCASSRRSSAHPPQPAAAPAAGAAAAAAAGPGAAALAAGVSLESDILHYYTVKNKGTILWTNKVNQNANCPLYHPWLEGPASTNPRWNCYKTFNDLESWMLDGTDLDSTLLTRKDWGERMKKFLLALSVLGDSGFRGIQFYNRHSPKIAAHEDTLSRFGHTDISIPVRRNIGTICNGAECTCINDAQYPNLRSVLNQHLSDPNLLPCIDDQGVYSVGWGCYAQYSANTSDSLGVWNYLGDFISGTNPSWNDLYNDGIARFSSEYVSDECGTADATSPYGQYVVDVEVINYVNHHNPDKMYLNRSHEARCFGGGGGADRTYSQTTSRIRCPCRTLSVCLN